MAPIFSHALRPVMRKHYSSQDDAAPSFGYVQEPSDSFEAKVLSYSGLSLFTITKFHEAFLQGKKAPFVNLYIVNKCDVDESLCGETTRLVNEVYTPEGKRYICEVYNTTEKKLMTINILERDLKLSLKPREDWTITEVSNYIIIPEMQRKQGIQQIWVNGVSKRLKGDPFKGAFVSQARMTSFSSLIEALKLQYAGKNACKVFIWWDIFCANQPLLCQQPVTTKEEAQRASKTLIDGLSLCVNRFEEKLLYLDDFVKPAALSRAWCVFEIYVACLHKRKMTVICDKKAVHNLRNRLENGDSNLVSVLSDLAVDNIHCEKPEDKENIINSIEKLSRGFGDLKNLVTTRLNKWIGTVLEALAKEKLKYYASQQQHNLTLNVTTLKDMHFFNSVAQFLYNTSSFKAAESYSLASLDIYSWVVTPEWEPRVWLWRAAFLATLGCSYQGMCRYKEAIECYESSLIEYDRFQDQNISVREKSKGILYKNLCTAHDKLGHYQIGLEYARKAQSLEMKVDKPTEELISTYLDMGGLYYKMGDFEQYLKYSELACELSGDLSENNKVGDNTFLAHVYNCVGMAYAVHKQFESALHYLNITLKIRLNVFGEYDFETAAAYATLGYTHKQMSKYTEALELFNKAEAILVRLVEESDVPHRDLIRIRHWRGITLVMLGCLNPGRELLEKAQQDLCSLLGDDNPESLQVISDLAFAYEKLNFVDKCNAQYQLLERIQSKHQREFVVGTNILTLLSN